MPSRQLTLRRRFRYGGHGALASAVFAVVFLLRWVTFRLDNDHFMHLAWAAEMVRGQWPVRDFVEPGFILQTLLSYLAFQGGHQLVGEALLVCAFVAGGALFTYLACRRAGFAIWLALLVVACAVCAYPRTYAYPKAFVYPVALWAIAGYARNPNRRTIAWLGVATAVAFLFRHDHGLWVACGCAVALLARDWPAPAALFAAARRAAAVAALIAAPWGLWVATSGHAGRFVADLIAAQSAVTSWPLPETPFVLDRDAPLVDLAPVDYPRIAVRWADGVSPAQREDLERRYSLQPVPNQDYRYRLTDVRRDNIRGLVLDPAVEDTNDIERGSFRVRGGVLATAYLRLQQYAPLLRVRLLPGLIQPANALPWLTWVSFALPFGVLAAGVAQMIRDRRQPAAGSPDTRLPGFTVAAAALAVLAFHGLVRQSPDSRLGDVAALTAVVVGITARGLWRAPGPLRLLARPTAVCLPALTLLAAVSYGRTHGRLADVDLATLAELRSRILQTERTYARRPLDIYAGPEATGLDRLARWLNTCTAADSRTAVIGFEPQVFLISERGFAGGLAFLYGGWNASEQGQQLALARWSAQTVPVVIAVESEWPSFSRDYPLIRQWIDDRYQVAARGSFGGNKELAVFIDRAAVTAGTDTSTGLPCFLGPARPVLSE